MISGQDYQEVLTNFPLGSELLTGLFLDVTTSGFDGNGQPTSQTVEKTLFDRLGYATRQNGTTSTVDLSGPGSVAFNQTDFSTLTLSPVAPSQAALATEVNTIGVLADQLSTATADVPSDPTLLADSQQQILRLSNEIAKLEAAYLGGGFLAQSDLYSAPRQSICWSTLTSIARGSSPCRRW